jgi:hypothetical protein
MSNNNVEKVSNKAIQSKQETTCTSHRKVKRIHEYKHGQRPKWKEVPLTPKPQEGKNGQEEPPKKTA